jgi:YidC/Oxa1 family membrane protein insertase
VGQIGYIFNVIFTDPIFNGLMLLYHLFGDFGLAIIVLTLVVKLVLFPLTLQNLKSMKAMQALQPELQKIRKQYAKDQQAQLQKTQALYKEYGVNPAGGCLPMLVQLPVLYGLFYAIRALIDAKNVQAINAMLYPFMAHFTTLPDLNLRWFTFLNPHWYISLTQPDPTHILPILAGLATFVQLRMSQPKTAANAPSNDPSAQSMKMMQYMMPLITVIFGWTFAAGLAVYWTTSSLFQAVQQYFVTGWGSLLIKPDFILGGSASSNSNGNSSKKETTQYIPTTSSKSKAEQSEETDSSQNDYDGDNTASTANNGRSRTTTTRTSGPSQYTRRRQRTGSASARRRGSAQRSRG